MTRYGRVVLGVLLALALAGTHQCRNNLAVWGHEHH